MAKIFEFGDTPQNEKRRKLNAMIEEAMQEIVELPPEPENVIDLHDTWEARAENFQRRSERMLQEGVSERARIEIEFVRAIYSDDMAKAQEYGAIMERMAREDQQVKGEGE